MKTGFKSESVHFQKHLTQRFITSVVDTP